MAVWAVAVVDELITAFTVLLLALIAHQTLLPQLPADLRGHFDDLIARLTTALPIFDSERAESGGFAR
jgi:hypothetical protein